MWRTIPLLKMALRMVVLGTGLFLVAQVLVQGILVRQSLQFDISTVAHLVSIGGKIGLSLAVPMLIVSAVFFRETQRPAFYRFTMLTVVLITNIVLWLGPTLEIWSSRIGQDSLIDKHVVIMVGFFALLTFMSHMVAGAYIRESRQRQRRNQEPAAKSSSRNAT